MALTISMVALEDDPQLSLTDIQQDMATKWPDLTPASEPEEKDGTLSFRVGAADVVIAKMPAPIPDLEGPCATSILWPNAADDLEDHKSHVIVTVMGELNPVELSTLLTQATASLMAVTPSALGVFWCNAALLVPKDIFIDFAVKVLPHGPPLVVWVDFRAGQDEDQSCSGFTQGMKALGLMEFESKNAGESPGELRERFLGLAGYLVENGPVINDGDTVGQDANERIRVVYSDSEFGHEGQVMRLVYEAAPPRKSWWKFW